MSSAPEGWYVDPSTGKNLRLWNGTKWTDEVAPLPNEAAHSGPVDLLAANRIDPYIAAPIGLFEGADAAVTASEAVIETAEPEVALEHDASVASEASVTSSVDTANGEPDAATLDPQIERTLLTRRELRARNGTQLVVDDAPKHLPQIAPPEAASLVAWEATATPLEIPAPAAAVEAPVDADVDDGRKTRILRMSVLLGILAVATSVAVLTAGTI